MTFKPDLKKPPKEKESNPYRYKRKVTGEAAMFAEIWKERPHVCINCREYLGGAAKPHFFSHIKSKGAHPELRLVKSNIQLLCKMCHWLFDQGTKQQFNARKK